MEAQAAQTQTLIVGGSSGVGLQMVRNSNKAGDPVTVLSRTWDHGAELPNVVHIPFDVISDDISNIELPQRIDRLAYCPGSINLKPIHALPIETLREDFELNVIGAVKVIQASINALKASAVDSGSPASILLFSTVAAGQGIAMHASVAASKGAIEGLTRSLAADLSPRIRVNCIAPALTNTPLAAKFFSSEEKAAALGKMYPLGRTGEADDVAALGNFLLSDQAAWITGQVIGVDGGMSAIKK